MALSLGIAISGSFCTFSKILEEIRVLKEEGYALYPILSHNAATLDTRFWKAADFRRELVELTGREPWTELAEVEPIGPKGLLDALVVAPLHRSKRWAPGQRA